ncbi:MAG: 2-C-methyl-D-erythritol 2,4-cyclodiphosphate synthase [Clostridia bacterium]
MYISAVIAAAGISCRYGINKLFTELNGKSLIEVTVSVFESNSNINQIILVCNDNDKKKMAELFENSDKVFVTTGGESRMQSVMMGLSCVDRSCDYVMIHDGARPYVTQNLINKLLTEAIEYGNAVACIPSTDTIYLTLNGENAKPLNRDNIMRAQTPQVFDFRSIMIAYQNFVGIATDDSQIYRQSFNNLHLTIGETSNIKVTFPCDITNICIGNGVDVHRLVEGRDLILGGVKIPYCKGLLGHSDADVLLHAIMDSLLSAANERDIGVQFPDSEPQYKNISSMTLLLKVCRILALKRICPQSVSATIICQQPKLMDYLPQMKENISSVLKIKRENVNISVTTSEKLGIIGQGDGIAAEAVSIVAL